MTERSTAVESSALAAILTGGALALVGTTLYWGRVTGTLGGFYLVRLADLNRIAAPVATLWLVLAAGGALAGRATSRLATMMRRGAMLLAMASAFSMLSLTTFLSTGSTVLAHAGITDKLSLVTAGRVVPDVGCLLYVVGLALIAGGAWTLEAATRPQPDPPPPGGRPTLHRVLITVTLILAVVSAVLPWYTSSAADMVVPTVDAVSPPSHDDAQAWLAVYRVGLAACLAITGLALASGRHAPRLRLLGLIVGVAVTVMLLSGYATLWRQPTLQYATDRIGPGYHLGIVTMLLLTASFMALPSGHEEVPEKAESPAEDEAEERP
jgi:hypothetical protein